MNPLIDYIKSNRIPTDPRKLIMHHMKIMTFGESAELYHVITGNSFKDSAYYKDAMVPALEKRAAGQFDSLERISGLARAYIRDYLLDNHFDQLVAIVTKS